MEDAIMESLEPIVGKIGLEQFKNYYDAAKSDIYRFMDAPLPTYPLGTPPTAGDFGSPGGKGLTNKNLTALEGQVKLWGNYYNEENRKVTENSEAKLLKVIARVAYASNAQIQKLESAIIRGLLASDQSNQKMIAEFEEIKSILYSLNGECSKGFKDLIPVDGSAIAANVEGLQKNLVNELVSSEARSNISRRADNTKLRDELKIHLKSGPSRRNSNVGRSSRAPSTASHLEIPLFDPASDSDQVFHPQTDNTSSSNTVTDTITITNSNAKRNNSTSTNTKTKPPHKVPNYDTKTGELSFTYAARAAANNTQKKNTRKNTPSQRGPDFELRDSNKNPEKAKRTAENQAAAEEKANREFIVYNLDSESSRVDFEAEFKRLGAVITECSTKNLGSQGHDFMKVEFKDVQLKRIYKYGGEGYTGIYPLKVECTSPETKEAVIRCAKAGGFFEKRKQVDIGWFQSGTMTAEEFKTKANKFHINISTTFLQRKINRNKKKEDEERKNSDEYKYNQVWRKFDTQITHTFSEQEIEKLWPSLNTTQARGPPNPKTNTSGQQISTTPETTPATTPGEVLGETQIVFTMPNSEEDSTETAMDQDDDPEAIQDATTINQQNGASNVPPVTLHPISQQEQTNNKQEPQTQSITIVQTHLPPGILSTGSPPAAVTTGPLIDLIDITSPVKQRQQEEKEEYDNLALELRIMEQKLLNHTKIPLLNEEEELACLQRKEELQIKMSMKNQINISLKPAPGSLSDRLATNSNGNTSSPPPTKKTRITSSSSAKRIIPNQQRPSSNSSPISKEGQSSEDKNSPSSPKEANGDKRNRSLNHENYNESLA